MGGQALGLCSGDKDVGHVEVGRWRSRLVESKNWADAAACNRRRSNDHITRLKMQEAAAGADAHERLNTEIQQLFHHDAGCWRPHPRRLHAHRHAVDGSRVAEEATVLVDELRLLESAIESRCDPLGAVRVSRHEDDWGVVAALGV